MHLLINNKGLHSTDIETLVSRLEQLILEVENLKVSTRKEERERAALDPSILHVVLVCDRIPINTKYN